jgi:hypothetical protein
MERVKVIHTEVGNSEVVAVVEGVEVGLDAEGEELLQPLKEFLESNEVQHKQYTKVAYIQRSRVSLWYVVTLYAYPERFEWD